MNKELVININNQKDINNFYRKLRIYKRIYNKKNMKLIISKNIINNAKEELLMCEKAFNIKNKKARLEYVYDALCDYHDKLYLNNNICEFDKNGLCKCQREHHIKIKKNGCCGTCNYMGKNGCTIKCLSCKNFFCNYIKKEKNIPSHKKTKLYKYFLSAPQKQIADVNYWTTKEDSLKVMYKNNYISNFIMKESRMRRL